MYANLEVRVEGYEPIAAWKVEVDSGIIVIHKDAHNGLGSYAEPNGTLEIALSNETPTFTILPNF